MSHDPAFLFYPNDWLGGTMGMTAEEKGAYIDLLVFQFNNKGHFTEGQAKQVLSICFASVWQVVKNKFKTEGENSEFLYNERLREEIEKRQAFSESRRINALHEKRPRKKKIKGMKAYAKYMGNENENRNIDINKKEKKVFVKPSLEEVRAYCLERKNKIDPQYFIDYQAARDWKLKGGQKIKDWKAVIRTWEKNDFEGGNNGTYKKYTSDTGDDIVAQANAELAEKRKLAADGKNNQKA
jgi:hypothetical protein